MHTWAKRGLQAALVTGGLLMLGTGIASADENVDPDRPASPIDATVSVPMHIANNAVGTPVGQKDLPAIDRDVTVGTADVTNVLPTQAQQAVAPVTKDVTAKAAPVVNKASSQVLGHDVLRGNRVDADVVVPVDVSGNALAAGGKANVVNDSQQSVSHDRPVSTDGSHAVLSGNVVDADWAAPVQVTGNAVSALGVANTLNNSSQDASATGDINTNGTQGVLSGNLAAPQFATPVQVTGNAITGGGQAFAVNQSDTTATSGGSLTADGSNSLLSGNAAGGPLAKPIEVNGNPVAGFGHASTLSNTSATATSGDTQTGRHQEPAYILSNGDPAVGSGSVAETGNAGPIAVNCNATAGVGAADCTGETTTDSTAGGAMDTTGNGSVASGTVASAPSSTPVELFGNTTQAGGIAATASDNATSTQSGGSTFTNGSGGIASASLVAAPVCGTTDAFGNVVSGAGTAASTTTNALDCTAGGAHDGTVGNDSTGSGSEIVTPVTLPTETFGNAATGLGTADTTTSEFKTLAAGGEANTDDDAGTLAANLVSTPVSGAAQAFGNGAGVLGYTNAQSDTTTVASAGGNLDKATGSGGRLSGNLAQVPLSAPVQAFANGATAGGRGNTGAVNDSSFIAGDDATTTGDHGLLTGNLATAPAGTLTQVDGAAAGALGNHTSAADNLANSSAGGDVTTTGAHGVGAGNVVSPQALPVADVFGDTAGATGGLGSSGTVNTIDALSGGDITTTGDNGFLSGNLAQVPAAAVPQAFGDAAGAVGGTADTASDNNTNGTVGGTTTTSGTPGSLSGLNGKVPVGAVAPVYNVPVDVLGKAFTQATNGGGIVVGDQNPQLFVPADGGLAADRLPRIPEFPNTPMRSSLPTSSIVPGLNAPAGLPFAGDLFPLPAVPGALPTTGLPGVGTGQLPSANLPSVGNIAPGEPTGGLPAVDGVLPALPGANPAGLPTAQLPTGGLPVIGDGVPALPTGELPIAQLPALASLDQAGLPMASLPVVGTPAMPLPTPIAGPATVVPTLPTTAVPELPTVMPALPAMDTGSVLPADQSSLADTAAKLQALFGQLPSATSLPMA